MAKKGDLLVTIKGDATSFDKTISESTNQVRKFNATSTKAGSSVGGFSAGMGKLAGTFGRVAGPLGIAITAISTLNKAMNATETSSDFFANNIAAAGDSVTQFFVALQTGDFSNFDKGLTDIYKRAKDAVEALDQLGNTAKSLQFIKAFGDLGISDLMEDIFDSDNVKDQLNMWEKAKGIAVEIKEAAEEQQKVTKTVIGTKFASYGLPADLITEDRISATFSLDAKVNKDQIKKEAKEGAKAYKEELKQLEKDSKNTYTKYTTAAGRTTSNKAKGFDREKYDKGKRELQEKYADALVTDIALNRINNNKELFPMVDAYIKSAQDLDAAQKGVNKLQKMEKKINQGTYGNAGLKNTSSSNTPTIFADGSFAKIDQEIKEWEKKYNEASDSVSRNHAQNMINALKDSKVEKVLEDMGSLDVNELNFDQIQEIKRTFNTLLGDVTDKDLRETIQKTIKFLDDSISKRELKIQAEMQAKWNISMPTSYDGVKQTFEEQKSLEQSIEKLTLQIKGTKDPSERVNLVDQRSTKEARLSELRAQQNRPYITNTLDEEVLNKLGIKGGQTVDFTDQKDLNKYKNHIFDVLEKFRSTFDDSTHNLYHQIVSKLSSELLLVGQRIWDLNDDEFNINLANILDQSNPENRQSLLNSLADVKVGIENREAQLQYMKNDFETLKLNREDSESLGAILMEIQAQEASVKGLIDFYNQLLGIYEVGQDNLIEKFRQNVEITNQWRDALSEVGNIFYHIGSISDESTARTLSGLSSVFGAIQQMIPALKTLTLMKQQDALAAAVSSGAAMPFPANLFAIASGTAAVIAGFAQMSSIPKFADGGIVYGNTIAQVGEYANASSNPEVIAPLSKLKNILADSGGTGGNVKFEIEGKKLVGVLDNYNSIKRKR